MDEIEQQLMLEYAKTNDAILQKMNGQVPNAAERRRYALLQAAAMICAANWEHFVGKPDSSLYVSVAEQLLAEIERREK